MALAWPSKDPNEVLDYKIDWSARLGTDMVLSTTWIVPAGITRNSDSNDSTSTTIWLASGTSGTTYALTNRITTAGGRTMDQTVNLPVDDK